MSSSKTPAAFPNARSKSSPRATMTVSSDIRAIDGCDDNGTEHTGTATVCWSVREAGQTARFSRRFASREAANAWANEKWSRIK